MNKPIKLTINGKRVHVEAPVSTKQSGMDFIRDTLALLIEFVCGVVVILAGMVALWAWFG